MSEIKVVGASRSVDWYKTGWGIFSGNILNWVLMALIFFVSVIALSLLPFVGVVCIYLLIPLFQGGMLQAAEKSAGGGSIDVTDLFVAFKDENKRNSLLILGALMLGTVIIATIISVPFIGGAMMSAMGDAPETGMPAMPSFGFGILLFGLVMGILLAMLFLYSPALVMLKGMKPVAAIKASFSASWKNFLPFVIFMLIYLLLAIGASIPFGLGFLVLLPVVTCAVYVSYRDLFS